MSYNGALLSTPNHILKPFALLPVSRIPQCLSKTVFTTVQQPELVPRHPSPPRDIVSLPPSLGGTLTTAQRLDLSISLTSPWNSRHGLPLPTCHLHLVARVTSDCTQPRIAHRNCPFLLSDLLLLRQSLPPSTRCTCHAFSGLL